LQIAKKTRSVTVRFKVGVPDQLSVAALKQGLYRAAWIRNAVLQPIVNAPLQFTTADGFGERILIRLTDEEFKTVRRRAIKHRVAIGAYVRACCMWVLGKDKKT